MSHAVKSVRSSNNAPKDTMAQIYIDAPNTIWKWYRTVSNINVEGIYGGHKFYTNFETGIVTLEIIYP